MRPKITIVTPALDASRYLEEAITSVPRHESDDVEHIVVYDGVGRIAGELREKYRWLHIVQGPARGATAATAKAIALSSGDFIFQLNSDDRMLPGSISALVSAASRRPDVEIWTGGTRIFKQAPDGREQTVRTLDDDEMTALTLLNVLDDLPLMTARFVRRSLYERVGGIDERFSACSDREFAIRTILAGAVEAPLKVRVSELRLHDESYTIRRPGQWVPTYLTQHIKIAVHHMSDKGLPERVRAEFRDWHARERLRKIYYEIRARKFADAAATVRDAFSCDRQWVLRLQSTAAMLRRRRRTDSARWTGQDKPG